jgi:hypothetical protein
MIVFIAIDDTDSISEGSTGKTANGLRRLVEEKAWGTTAPVTRHQLLVHPDIPYTSHNSAMCFKADIALEAWDDLISGAGQFLKDASVAGSDPGLCIAREDITNPSEFCAFGYRAKKEIVRKEEAYLLAQRLAIHLSEHGGTGDGVIGALAGAALRMSGNDGRFQGRTKLKEAGEKMSVAAIKSSSDIEVVEGIEGYILQDSEEIILGEVIKTVLLKNKRKLLVFMNQDGFWQTCSKQQLRQY